MLVFIDAGHGGTNSGCVHNGVTEKDFTLAAAKQLAGLLVEARIGHTLSRWEDDTVTLEERGRLSSGADLVVSIHADAAADPAAGFLGAYVLPGDEVGQEVALEVERAAPNTLRPRTPGATLTKSIGWTQRAHNVLRPHAPRPAVLVECGFLSNPRHAAYLSTSYGLAAVGLTLAAGVVRAAEILSTRKAA